MEKVRQINRGHMVVKLKACGTVTMADEGVLVLSSEPSSCIMSAHKIVQLQPQSSSLYS